MRLMLHHTPAPWDRFVSPTHPALRRTVAQPGFRPATNISRDEQGYTLTLAVPGRSKDAFRLEIEGDTLIVRGEGHTPEGTYTHREFRLESFERRFRLSGDIDTTAVAASYTDGLLRISLPLKAEAQPQTREITIA